MFNKLFFSFVSSLIKTGQKNPLTLNDIPDLPPLWDPEQSLKDFDGMSGGKSRNDLSIQVLKALKQHGYRLALFMFLIPLYKMTSPVLIHKLIEAVGLAAEGGTSVISGVSIALSLCLAQLFSSILGQHHTYHAV